MFITIDSYLFQCCQWADKTLMQNLLSTRSARYHILGESSEQPHEFFSIIIQSVDPKIGRMGIGICSLGIGLAPHILPIVQAGKIIFGFNSEVHAVTLGDVSTSFQVELDSLFYCFVPLLIPNRILVQHEIGLVMLTQEGEIIWKFARDIITKQQIENGKVFLEFMDSPSVSLSLESGKILS